MRSPAVLGLKESPFGSDVVSILSLQTSHCKSESESSCEPEMQCSGDKSAKDYNISIDKDSGIDSDNDFKAPDPTLVETIVTQVESYFSDENLVKDEFVLKHIRRNKDGFISLKLLSSFRKVKALTKSWKVVAYCVKVGSKKLEINPEGTKIRRRAPLPAVDGDKYSRTIIAFNFAEGADDINSISKVFSRFGEIALIRILKSGSSSVIPQYLLNRIKESYDLSKTTVATIEYYGKSGADKALTFFEESSFIQTMAMKSTNTRPHRSSLRWSESSDSNERRENQRNYQKKSYQEKVDISLDIKRSGDKKNPMFWRQKSKSYSSGEELKPTRAYEPKSGLKSSSESSKSVPIIRMPLGLDGTAGFHSHKSHRSSTL